MNIPGNLARRLAGRVGIRRRLIHIEFPGGHRRRVTPVPIPNTEVKPSTADGTAWATVWESRSLPGIYLKSPKSKGFGLLLFMPARSLSAYDA